jgi:hypothetical protein
MTMPSSGALNMGGTSSPVSVAQELGLGLTTTISMNQSNVRSLAGVGGSGTTWGMNSLYGKSARSFSLASLTSIDGTAYPGDEAFAYFIFYSDGYINYFTSSGNGTMGQWTTPITAGIGSSYWIRLTETGGAGTATETGSGRGIWNQLNVDQTFGLSRSANGGAYRTYTVDIASDSGGSNIVATTSVTISVEIIF